jgi:hypothetical protein
VKNPNFAMKARQQIWSVHQDGNDNQRKIIRKSGTQERKETGMTVSTEKKSPDPRLGPVGAARGSEGSNQEYPAT